MLRERLNTLPVTPWPALGKDRYHAGRTQCQKKVEWPGTLTDEHFRPGQVAECRRLATNNARAEQGLNTRKAIMSPVAAQPARMGIRLLAFGLLSARFASTIQASRAAAGFSSSRKGWVQLWLLRARPMVLLGTKPTQIDASLKPEPLNL
jgi:hypothetical protein